jgi:hypothetical protein
MPLVGEDRPPTGRRLTVDQTATALGITADAVRSRIKRGTLAAERSEEGRVWVLLDSDRPSTSRDQPIDRPSESNALISEMRARIDSLERQLEQANERDRENRRIIAALTSRIPELPAPQEPPESPETAAETPMGPEPKEAREEAQEAAESRSWWRRIFGG